MPNTNDALLDATVSGISDLELRIAARRELGECITAADESTVSRALDRFAKAGRSSRPDLWRWILLGIVLILSLSVGTPHVTSCMFYYDMKNYGWGDQEEFLANARKKLGHRGWTRQQEAFLFGEAAGMSTEESLLHHRRMAEQDQVMLGEYVRVYMNKKSALPPDLPDLATTVDPNNAIFDYCKASRLAKDSVKMADKPHPESWEIKEPEKLSQAILALADATAKPTFNSHLREAVEKRKNLLHWSTRNERLCSSNFIFSSPSFGSYLYYLSWAICAEAQRLAVGGDRDEFVRLAAMAETYWQRQLADNDPTLFNSVMLLGEISVTSESLALSAGTLGLEEEERRYFTIKNSLKNRSATIRANTNSLTGREPLAIKSGDRTGSSRGHRLVVQPPPVDEQLLLPTSYADHAFLSRALTLALWVLLLVSAGILMIHHATAPRVIRTTGRHIARLLDWKDHAIIAAISFVLPVAYVMAVSRLTPFGAREFNLTGTYNLMPAAHFASLFIMLVTAAILTVQWRIRRRAAFFGLGRGWPTLITWIALAAATLHVPLIGWYVIRQNFDEVTLYFIPILLVPGLIALVSVAFRSSFGSFQGRLSNELLVRALIPVFGVMMIGTVALLPIFKAEEDFWFRQDRFVVNLQDPVYPFTYDKAVAERIKEEIHQILKTN
jgi:hypothetical protein